MMLRFGACGTWLGTDLSLKWEWVKTGHMFWLMLLIDTTPDQIIQVVGAGAAPRSSRVNTDFLSTQLSPDPRWVFNTLPCSSL